MHQIVTTLFPPGGERSAYVPISIGEIPAVTTDEILSVVKRISDKKAPGLDGIPNVALKAAMRANPDIFATSLLRVSMKVVFQTPGNVSDLYFY